MRKFSRKIFGAMNRFQEPGELQDSTEGSKAESLFTDAFYKRMFDRDIYLHISEISVVMLGVCLTGVSILNVDQENSDGNSPIDDLLAIDAIVFLICYLLAYWIVRIMTKGNSPTRGIGNIVNAIFLLGMIVMAIVCVSIVIQGDLTSHISLLI
jgi:hypothetical protein